MADEQGKKPKQSGPVLASRFGKPLGFGSGGGFKTPTLSQKGAGFNPSNFKMTQNKGSGSN